MRASPKVPSPQELHQAVHAGLMRCNASGFADPEAFGAVAESLDRWVSEYPDQAKDVEHLALGACYSATLQHGSAAAARIGTAGLDASLIRPKPTVEDRASAVLLQLLTAEACLSEGRLGDGQVLLDDAGHALGNLERVGPLAPYLVQRFELLSGAFAESALERAAAAPCFARALAAGGPLLRNRIRLRSLGRHWVPMVFGTGPELLQNGEEQAADLLKRDLLQTYRRAALAYARTADDAAEGARCAVEACIELGLPPDTTTLEMRPALLALPAADFEAHFEALLERADEMESPRRQAVWRAAIRLARGRVRSRAGDTTALVEAHRETLLDLKTGADGMTWIGALSDMLTEREPREGAVQAFMQVYNQIAAGEPAAALRLPLRVQFDDAIGVAISWAFDELRTRPSAEAARTLSVLFDGLRSPDVEELKFVTARDGKEEELPAGLTPAYEAALDRLGRLRYAMMQLPQSCAVVMQTVGDRILFAAATGDKRTELILDGAGVDYLEAARALAQGLTDAIRDPALDTTERIEELGRAAFSAMPEELQALLRRRKHVFLVPDFWAEREGIPFELFHDGRGFLCLRKVIARSLSLRELVRSVEPPLVRQGIPRRSVCLAVSEAEGLTPLAHAASEVQGVRQVLVDAGWDAPETPSWLGPSRLVDAMELAGVTHIAAHGKVHAGGEALLLGQGSTLTVEEIEERPRNLGGLVFLNACSLGRARYLGGGLTRSIAAALVRGGARCVISNLLPVEDRSASELAAAFYRGARRRSVGEALRLARKELADRGVPPSRWGTTILLGTPRLRITERAAHGPSRESAAEVLYRHSVPEDAGAEASASMREALSVIEDSPDHVRLRGALEWVQAAARIEPGAPADEALAAASVARALDCRPGEALFLFAATRAMDDAETLRPALGQAIRALAPLAPLNDVWHRMHVEVLADRKKLDTRREVPFIDGELRVNDPDDPATQAFLQIQDAVDQKQIREKGPLRYRRPERTLEEVAWNAIVIGQQNRFSGEDSQAGFAGQMALKLEGLGLIPPEATGDVRRILGGLLAFFWERQRITHLEPDRAMGQAETLRLMLERVVAGFGADIRALLQTVADAVDATDDVRSASGDRFLRALEALTSDAPADDTAGNLEKRIRETLDHCAEISPEARAEAAAWVAGLLLERAHDARRRQPPAHAMRDRILRTYGSIYGDIEGWLYPYLMDGFRALREERYDFVQHWKWDTV